jgi:eukaryotic-like serine/threonine-protein kinase
MFQGGPTHSGVSASAGPAVFGGLKWRLQTDGPVRSSPVIANHTLYVGSGDGSLYAINTDNGVVRWKTSLGSSVTSTPAVSTAHGVVVVGTFDGAFHGITLATGRTAWSMKPGAALPLAWGIESGQIYTSSPAIVGTTVVVGSIDGNVYAADVRTGRARWRYNLGARVYSSPAVATGVVYVGGQDGTVHAIDLATGRCRWRFDTEGTRLKSADFGFDRTTVQSSPSVANGVVFVGARDGWLYAIDAASGTERWRFDHKVSWVNSTPAVSEGMVFAGSSDGHFVQAVDATTGQERWRAMVSGIVWGSPAVDADRVYVGEGDGTMYAIDKRNGQILWRYRVGHRVMSSALAHQGVLYFGSDDGAVYAVRGGDKPLRRAVYFDSALAAQPQGVASASLRNYLRSRQYDLLDAEKLERFMSERVADREPSVVVFAADRLPASVLGVASDTTLFRRYLGAGGKVVWTGPPLMLWPTDAKSLKDLRRDAAEKIIGVSFGGGNFDPLGVSRISATGRALGLPSWYLDTWGADARSVDVVYAQDEMGQASVWAKSFGGPPGTGFVRVFTGDGTPGRPILHSVVQSFAELRP